MPFPGRRRALIAALLAPGMLRCAAAQTRPRDTTDGGHYAAASQDHAMQFPRDHGSHPDFRVEWWYVTGWLQDAQQHELGFQITFFRARPQLKPGNPSRFNPEHILIAHAAIADRRRGRLLHAQRAARQGFGLAGSDRGDTRVWIDGWQLRRDGNVYRTLLDTAELGLSLTLAATRPPLLQGAAGYSRKGPRPESASHYYSVPQLNVDGTLRAGNAVTGVRGTAWLDHEWSSSYLDPDAAGWDWIGINLADGGALMAFRMRDRRGGVLWAGGARRDAAGNVRILNPAEVQFSPLRRWRSPRTGTEYPVAFEVRAGTLVLTITPLMDDQEHDTRATTGAIYWEGATTALQAGRKVGHGYLELTGYDRPLAL